MFLKKRIVIAVLIIFSIKIYSKNNNYKIFTTQNLEQQNQFQNWWDILHYDITIYPNIENKTLKNSVEILFKAKQTNNLLQLNLHKNFIIDSVYEIEFFQNKKRNIKYIPLTYKFDSNKLNINFNKSILKNQTKKIIIHYHGKPMEAIKPPWDGGVVWSKDTFNVPFISVACQETGAYVWLPSKSNWEDKLDNGFKIHIITPDSLIGVANGIFKNSINIIDSLNKNSINKKTIWNWETKSPINTYNINFTIGNLINFKSTYKGKKGNLNLSYWVLKHNLKKAQKQFQIVNKMLKCFEDWFGNYPFYNDGYKLIETPFLGMEHQSGIAYGNNYLNGYRGKDLSSTGWGLNWDFIIIHESGHEWFGNNITAKNINDMWIHEGFTSYSEVLFTEFLFNEVAANEYCVGIRKNIKNNIPLIYKTSNHETDIYYKGANLIHIIRNSIYNDKLFKRLLRSLNTNFYHKTTTSSQIEKFISKFVNFNFEYVFEQYLRNTTIPDLEYYFENNNIFLRWNNCIDKFNLPLYIPLNNKMVKIFPKTKLWINFPINENDKQWWEKNNIEKFYYITLKNIDNY